MASGKSSACCRVCGRLSEPRQTGEAPEGWTKHIDPPGCGAVTYTCDRCPEFHVGDRVNAALHDERFAGPGELVDIFGRGVLRGACYVRMDATGDKVATHLSVLTRIA